MELDAPLDLVQIQFFEALQEIFFCTPGCCNRWVTSQDSYGATKRRLGGGQCMTHQRTDALTHWRKACVNVGSQKQEDQGGKRPNSKKAFFVLLYFFLSQLRSRSEARAEISNFLRKSDVQSISWGGGSIAQWLAYMLLDPAATGLIPSISKIANVD